MYADDTTIVISHSNITDLMLLSSSILHLFSVWFKANKLALNDQKTKFVIFSRSAIPDNRIIDLTFDSYCLTFDVYALFRCCIGSKFNMA
jgi:hypothetical protein